MVDMTENTAQAEPTDKTNKILVNVVLDRSGSMGSVRQSTIDGYNEYLNGLRKDTESEYTLTLIQFDLVAAKADLTISYVDKPLAEVHDLTPADYEPRGSTPLYDAIGECIRRVEAKGRGVITLIVTDGHENASTEFTRDSVKALIADKEKRAPGKNPQPPDYLSPDAVASSLGVTRRTVYRWLESGKLPAVQIGRTWRIKQQDIDSKRK